MKKDLEDLKEAMKGAVKVHGTNTNMQTLGMKCVMTRVGKCIKCSVTKQDFGKGPDADRLLANICTRATWGKGGDPPGS